MARSSGMRFGVWSGIIGVFVFMMLLLGAAAPGHSTMLKVGLLSEPKTLNPFIASDKWAREVLRHLEMPLYIYEPEDISLVPWLADGQPEFSEDSKTVTVKLRDAKWSDGTPFTAEDILFTYQVVTELDIPRHRSRYSDVEKVEALDPHTVRYTMKKPEASFQSRALVALIVQKKYWAPVVEKAKKSENPLSFITSYNCDDAPTLGPFMLSKWTRGSSILLLKNKNFFGTGMKFGDLVIGPYIDGILFKFYGNADAGILALKKGDVDFIGWSISPGYLQDLEKDPQIKIFTNTKSGFIYIGFNCHEKPFSYPEFRQAVAYLINKEFLVKRVLQGMGSARNSIIPPGNKFWYNPDLPAYGTGEPDAVRVKKAYDLLKNAGWTWQVPPIDESGKIQKAKGLTMPDGQVVGQFDLLTPPADYDPNRAISAMLISEWMNNFGIPVVARPMAFSAMLQKVKSERNFEMFILGYGFIQPDPDIMRSFFSSKSDRKNGRNLTGFNDKEYDKLAEESSATINPEKRREIIFKLEEIIAGQVPMIPIFTPSEIEAVRKDKFTGWVSTQDGIGNLWSYLVLKPVK